MIGCVPWIYDDELMYSYFARIGVHNGYMLYSQLSQDLYGKIIYNPSVEFTDKLLPDVERYVVGNGTVRDLILNHTMFSFYAGFLDDKRKNDNIKRIEAGTGEYYKGIPMPKTKKSRYLRYCPVCVKEDRNNYNETFWHISHQLQGIDVCYKHCCKLINSEILISSGKSTKLMTAEECMLDNVEVIIGNDIEIKLAKYTIDVLTKIRNRDVGNVGLFLNYSLIGTEYLSKRGDHRFIVSLCKNFVEYYSGIGNIQSVEIYKSRVENILKGKRVDFIEICQLAMFLGISTQELVECNIKGMKSLKDYRKDFDDNVLELIKNGVGINEIARKLKISNKTVRDIRDNKYKLDNRKKRGKGGRISSNWDKLDEEQLPIVLDAIERLKNNGKERPKKINKHSVCKLLEISYERFDNYNKCNQIVKENTESNTEYWARELEWAVRKIEEENRTVNITNIQKCTNMDKINVVRSLPYIKDNYIKKTIEGCLDNL